VFVGEGEVGLGGGGEDAAGEDEVEGEGFLVFAKQCLLLIQRNHPTGFH